ncbi:HAMP domain-containing sensor histidine kinase [Cocleimonas sp. KMM 6892]|uniref:sensor histidine kinase n=1 Tax=unclassified Cocleimonas TaxID=2639732 RepID=UPI002DBE95A1|nr:MULTISPECIES: HAMP domain-containing sensor histidine kinase [unclassified Cocleimonas]MEB8431583.1 HAMP domain-containing sensor histidine kinase [Cocleimonas sp. KMM 6892]MEC4713645.1 HAMP domain-containing sensor histidine kinase [Cocleimonas sp. KMM 6895]MEC4742976.1 HAMP domain-containing sensor histidine kinase [Cocleimonas sp. KMM 6896]
MMTRQLNLANRFDLNRIFSKRWILQTLFIIFAVLVSIITITWILEKSLVKQAMELEADAFISHYQKDKSFPLPRTRNLIGYLTTPESTAETPDEISGLAAGLYPKVIISGRDKPVPVYIRDFDNNRLYLIFEGANIDRLVGVFGLIPMSILLILIYSSSWIAYKLTWRAASPVLNIARNLRNSGTSGTDSFALKVSTKNLSGETKELAEALDEYAKRIDVFVERERQFTADVSHELRTPMTIIDGAAQFLETESGISSKGIARVKMIRRACSDVNDLTSAFFLMAREQKPELDGSKTNVTEIIENEVIKLSSLIDSSKIDLSINIQNELSVNTHRKALEIIIGNILGNAIKYTEKGAIEVTVAGNQVMVSDTGIGIPDELLPKLFERHVRGRGLHQAGEGIGLAIVKRLCDQFDWDISIQNNVDQGILATLTKIEKETQDNT